MCHVDKLKQPSRASPEHAPHPATRDLQFCTRGGLWAADPRGIAVVVVRQWILGLANKGPPIPLPRPKPTRGLAPRLAASPASLAQAQRNQPASSAIEIRSRSDRDPQRSTSPKTTSRVPIMVTTSASMWPLESFWRAARCAKPGARMWHLYGRLVPSETM